MITSSHIWLPDALKTRFAGHSLASSLYRFPVDILLSGPLGVGKTSFVQGLAEGLGITDPLASPTYALEQRYVTPEGIPFFHLDLYRIKESQVFDILAQSDRHEGIRCIEWSERMRGNYSHPTILVDLQEKEAGRILSVEFNDMPLPSMEQIEGWYREFKTPAHVVDHCRMVAECAEKLGTFLLQQGVICRVAAMKTGGLIHDVLRFIDFRPEAAPAHIQFSAEEQTHWASVRSRYPGMRHEDAMASLLRDAGYAELASIVQVHGLQFPSPQRNTIEQKLLYYADKRVAPDAIVTVDERFAEFIQRYGKGIETDQARIWHNEALAIERELFPDGPPF